MTRTPNSAITCASSHPIAPPPITTSDDGSSVSCTASRLVQYGVSARPGIGGAAGAVPVLITIPFVAVYVVPPTSTRPSPASTPAAADERRAGVLEPLHRDRVVPVVGGLVADPRRDRRPVGADRATMPAIVFTRPASRRVWAAAIIIFEGTQPK